MCKASNNPALVLFIAGAVVVLYVSEVSIHEITCLEN